MMMLHYYTVPNGFFLYFVTYKTNLNLAYLISLYLLYPELAFICVSYININCDGWELPIATYRRFR